MTLEIDFETRSDVDLRKHGAHVYFSSPYTDALLASYRIDGGPLRRWRRGEPCPADIRAHVDAGGMVSAHNNSFERQLWQMILTPRHGWPSLSLEQCRCTAATAAALALPRALGDLGTALGLTTQKDKEGSRLIRKFSIPRRPRRDEDPDGLYFNEPEDHPEDFGRFHDYCDVDVQAEAEADSRMIPLSQAEQELYVLNERVNDRGIRIDRESALSALALAAKAKAAMNRELCLVTEGEVPTCTQPDRLVSWIERQGVALSSAAKAELTDLLEVEDLPERVRKAIEIRQEAAKTSVSKLQAMLDRASADGRVRGTSLFCGASTGRFQSIGVNTSNMPRPRREYDDAHLDTRVLFEAFRTEDPETLKLLYGDVLGRPLHLISDAIRGFIWSAPGHELVQADYTGIEGAVAAWVTDETWKVEALHEILADPSLPDMYRRTAANIMGTTTDVITKKHPLRQSVGKVSELSLGYAGGVAAFYSMSRNYGVNLDPLYGPVWEAATPERREKAVRRYDANLRSGKSRADVLSRDAWIACELIKVGWRAANPAISGSWKMLDEAIRNAIQEPGKVCPALGGRVSYLVKHGFLWCRLPSGRCLAYASPRLNDQVWARLLLKDGTFGEAEVIDRDRAEKLAQDGKAEIDGSTSPKATALGVDSATRRFTRFALYGGLAFENVVQAIARDLLVNGMRKAEAAGYPIIATVYDEIICEVPRGFGDLKDFERLICELPEWAAGLPLSAGGWRGKRYRKD